MPYIFGVRGCGGTAQLLGGQKALSSCSVKKVTLHTFHAVVKLTVRRMLFLQCTNSRFHDNIKSAMDGFTFVNICMKRRDTNDDMKPKDFLPVEIMNEYVNQKSQYIALPCQISDLGIITESPKL